VHLAENFAFHPFQLLTGGIRDICVCVGIAAIGRPDPFTLYITFFFSFEMLKQPDHNLQDPFILSTFAILTLLARF
jgi:hypothetical protein